jgi:hypothetical protein
MTDWYEEILPAHKSTFEWVFRSPETKAPWSNFAKWLETGSGIYWMNGKAGPGKSTLT